VVEALATTRLSGMGTMDLVDDGQDDVVEAAQDGVLAEIIPSSVLLGAQESNALFNGGVVVARVIVGAAVRLMDVDVAKGLNDRGLDRGLGVAVLAKVVDDEISSEDEVVGVEADDAALGQVVSIEELLGIGGVELLEMEVDARGDLVALAVHVDVVDLVDLHEAGPDGSVEILDEAVEIVELTKGVDATVGDGSKEIAAKARGAGDEAVDDGLRGGPDQAVVEGGGLGLEDVAAALLSLGLDRVVEVDAVWRAALPVNVVGREARALVGRGGSAGEALGGQALALATDTLDIVVISGDTGAFPLLGAGQSMSGGHKSSKESEDQKFHRGLE
jgi:hypothetical protein